MHFLYSFSLKFVLATVALTLLLFFMGVKSSYASITGAKDTLSTSRPSPSSPLNATLGSTDTQATIFSNGSRFLASDSAKLIKTATTAIVDGGTIVSSQSAGLTTVYFGQQAGTAGVAAADVLYVPITAMHTVEFTVGTQVPVSGILRLTFPTLTTGDSDNDASPSATTFQFNNLISGGTGPIEVWNVTDNSEITSNITFSETEPSAGSGGVITMTLDGATDVDLGDQVRIFIGCTASSVSSCTTQAPRIINPTKSSTLGTGDSWKLRIDTRTAADGPLESAIIGITTIESVTVRATVDPTLSFTIAGVNNGSSVASTGCSIAGVNTNSGIASTANEVNLGIVQNTGAAGTTPPNIAAQVLTVSTNASSGYAVTATSASSLLNEATGFFFLTQTTPSYFAASSDFFGLHPCGNDVGTTWIEGAAAGSSNCNYQVGNNGATDDCFWAWPNPGNSLGAGTTLNIASDTGGPIGTGTGETGDGITSVSYAAGTDVLVPPGEYRAVITYVATPAF